MSRWASVLALVSLVACAPGIRVTRLKPSRFNLGTTKKVAVLEVNGDPSVTPVVYTELQKQVFDRRYYQLINALNRGLSISVNAAGARIDIGGVRQQVDADVYVVANLLRYELQEIERQETRSQNGRNYSVTTLRPEAHVRINFQVVKADGQVVVFRDYDGVESGSSYDLGSRGSYSRAALFEQAMRESVGSFLDDITPRQVVEKIELDDSDPSLKPGVKLAEDGDLGGAERSWSEVAAKDAKNAGAIYNLGVLLETRGEFDQAAANYRKAYELSPKSLYRDAIEDLNQRIADAQSLQQQI